MDKEDFKLENCEIFKSLSHVEKLNAIALHTDSEQLSPEDFKEKYKMDLKCVKIAADYHGPIFIYLLVCKDIDKSLGSYYANRNYHEYVQARLIAKKYTDIFCEPEHIGRMQQESSIPRLFGLFYMKNSNEERRRIFFKNAQRKDIFILVVAEEEQDAYRLVVFVNVTGSRMLVDDLDISMYLEKTDSGECRPDNLKPGDMVRAALWYCHAFERRLYVTLDGSIFDDQEPEKNIKLGLLDEEDIPDFGPAESMYKDYTEYLFSCVTFFSSDWTEELYTVLGLPDQKYALNDEYDDYKQSLIAKKVASKYYNGVVTLIEENCNKMLHKSLVPYAEGKFNEASEELEKYSKCYVKDRNAILVRCALNADMNNIESAFLDCENLLKADCSFVPAKKLMSMLLICFAKIHIQLKQFDKAEEALLNVFDLDMNEANKALVMLHHSYAEKLIELHWEDEDHAIDEYRQKHPKKKHHGSKRYNRHCHHYRNRKSPASVASVGSEQVAFYKSQRRFFDSIPEPTKSSGRSRSESVQEVEVLSASSNGSVHSVISIEEDDNEQQLPQGNDTKSLEMDLKASIRTVRRKPTVKSEEKSRSPSISSDNSKKSLEPVADPTGKSKSPSISSCHSTSREASSSLQNRSPRPSSKHKKHTDRHPRAGYRESRVSRFLKSKQGSSNLSLDHSSRSAHDQFPPEKPRRSTSKSPEIASLHSSEAKSQRSQGVRSQRSPGARSGHSAGGKSGHSAGAASGHSAGARSGHSAEARSGHSAEARSRYSPGARSRRSPRGRSHHSPGGRSRHSPGGRSRHSPRGRSRHSPGGRSRHLPVRYPSSSGSRSRYSPRSRSQYSPGSKSRVSPGCSSRRSPSARSRHAHGSKSRHSPGARSRRSPGARSRRSPGARSRRSPGARSRHSPEARFSHSLVDKTLYSSSDRRYSPEAQRCSPRSRRYSPGARSRRSPDRRNYERLPSPLSRLQHFHLREVFDSRNMPDSGHKDLQNPFSDYSLSRSKDEMIGHSLQISTDFTSEMASNSPNSLANPISTVIGHRVSHVQRTVRPAKIISPRMGEVSAVQTTTSVLVPLSETKVDTDVPETKEIVCKDKDDDSDTSSIVSLALSPKPAKEVVTIDSD